MPVDLLMMREAAPAVTSGVIAQSTRSGGDFSVTLEKAAGAASPSQTQTQPGASGLRPVNALPAEARPVGVLTVDAGRQLRMGGPSPAAKTGAPAKPMPSGTGNAGGAANGKLKMQAGVLSSGKDSAAPVVAGAAASALQLSSEATRAAISGLLPAGLPPVALPGTDTQVPVPATDLLADLLADSLADSLAKTSPAAGPEAVATGAQAYQFLSDAAPLKSVLPDAVFASPVSTLPATATSAANANGWNSVGSNFGDLTAGGSLAARTLATGMQDASALVPASALTNPGPMAASGVDSSGNASGLSVMSSAAPGAIADRLPEPGPMSSPVGSENNDGGAELELESVAGASHTPVAPGSELSGGTGASMTPRDATGAWNGFGVNQFDLNEFDLNQAGVNQLASNPPGLNQFGLNQSGLNQPRSSQSDLSQSDLDPSALIGTGRIGAGLVGASLLGPDLSPPDAAVVRGAKSAADAALGTELAAVSGSSSAANGTSADRAEHAGSTMIAAPPAGATAATVQMRSAVNFVQVGRSGRSGTSETSSAPPLGMKPAAGGAGMIFPVRNGAAAMNEILSTSREESAGVVTEGAAPVAPPGNDSVGLQNFENDNFATPSARSAEAGETPPVGWNDSDAATEPGAAGSRSAARSGTADSSGDLAATAKANASVPDPGLPANLAAGRATAPNATAVAPVPMNNAASGAAAEKTAAPASLPATHQMLDSGAVPTNDSTVGGPAAPLTPEAALQMHMGLHTNAFGNVEIHTVIEQSQVGVSLQGSHELARWFTSEVSGLEAGLKGQHLNLTGVNFDNARSGVQTATGFQQGQQQQNFSQAAGAGAASLPAEAAELESDLDSTLTAAPLAEGPATRVSILV